MCETFFAIGFIVFHRLLVSQIDPCHLKLTASPDACRTAMKPKRVRWSWGDWNEAAPTSRMTLQCLHNPFITFTPLNSCYFMQESDSGESFTTVTLIKSTPGCESGPRTIQAALYAFENVWRVFLCSVGTLNRSFVPFLPLPVKSLTACVALWTSLRYC